MKPTLLTAALPTLLLVPLVLPSQDGRVVKLNGPMPRPTVATIVSSELAPEGGLAVLRADLLVDEQYELFSVPTDGSGAAVRLNDPLPAGGDVTSSRIVPGRGLVVYLGDQRTDNVREVYSVPLDRTHPPVRLNRDPAPGGLGVLTFDLSADGTRIAYIGDLDEHFVEELYGNTLDGVAGDVKLSGAMTEGGDVDEFALTSDGRWAVYVADQDTDETFELWSVAPDLTRVKLNGPLIPAGDVAAPSGPAFLISPDDSTVVYSADHEFDGYYALFSVPIDGSAPPVRLSPPLGLDEKVSQFRIDHGSSRVVFCVLRDFSSYGTLYAAPLDGSTPAQLLSYQARPTTLEVDPTGARVLFVSASYNLISVRMDGSGGVQLDPPPYSGEVLSFHPSPDGASVVFRTRSGGVTALCSVPTDGSRLPTVLSLHADRAFHGYSVLPDSSTVLFVGQKHLDGPTELLRVPIDRSLPPSVLSAPLVEGGSVYGFSTSADGSEVLYRATQNDPTVTELFSVPSDGSTPAVRVNPPLPPGPSLGDVSAIFRIGAGDRRVVYAADQEQDGLFELFGVPIDAGSPPVKLSQGREVEGLEVTSDGQRVLHLEQTELDPWQYELLSGPLDTSAPALSLAVLTVVGDYLSGEDIVVSPDSSRVLCQLVGFAYPSSIRGPVVSAPVDGSSPAFQLTAAGARVAAISPDSQHAVWTRSSGVFSRRLDGSGPELPLTAALPPGTYVGWVRVTPDSARVVYDSDAENPGVYELYSVPIDGSTPPVRLSGPSAGLGVSDFAITADSAEVAFAVQTTTGAFLFACPTDGSPGILELASLASTGSEASPRIGASGLVVFRDLLPDASAYGLRSVPVDGSSGPLWLSGSAGGDWVLSPDGVWAVYTSSLGVFSVPVDGSLAPSRLSRTASLASEIGISADASTVAFRIQKNLFRAPIDGSTAASHVNGRLVTGGAVDRFRLTADGSSVVYRADQDENEAYELWAGHHFGYKRPASGPGNAGGRGVH